MVKVSEEYSKLYHYTNWVGLLGIWNTQSLWATHCRFLNDYTEILLFRDKLISLMHPYAKKGYEILMKQYPSAKQKIEEAGGLKSVIQYALESYVDNQYNALGEEIYITSFCGEHRNENIDQHGLLSQWRGYGTGGGFALVFDTKSLEELLLLEWEKYGYDYIHFSNIIYSDEEEKFEKELSHDLDILADCAQNIFFNPSIGKLDRKKKKQLEETFYPFVDCITRYKHFGFREENEVRIVTLPTVLDKAMIKLAKVKKKKLRTEKKINYRNNNRIPYIELFTKLKKKLPIEKIIVGPHIHQGQRASTLKTLLRKTDIEITCSKIPYVGQ